MSISVCLLVCMCLCVSLSLCPRAYLRNYTFRFIVHVTYGCCRSSSGTGAEPAMKPIGDPQDGRWKTTLMFDGRRFCIPKFRSSTLQQTTRQWRHWWFPITSCFGATNHGRLASLWLVRQDRATINSGSPPSCDVTCWQSSVASPSEMCWLASKVSRYLSILCLCLLATSR